MREKMKEVKTAEHQAEEGFQTVGLTKYNK